MDLRIGFGTDIHRLVRSRPLILGGIEIESENGALGHSDADVLSHAIIDAILGALNLGDIGSHFPDHDEKYKNISSLSLLNKVNQMMINKGYGITNMDCTIILESPKLNPYFSLIREKLSEILTIDEDLISLKAKTNEKLDSIGRGEAIQAFCSLILKKA